MLVGFDTEYGYRRVVKHANGRLHGDQSSMQPVCACLYFADGREVRISENFGPLQDYFEDRRYTFLVHGAHAEFGFCRRVGIRFPSQFRDTLLMAVLLLHASEFRLPGGAYKNAALAELTCRYGIPFLSAGDKDMIRESIMRLTHLDEFGMARVLDYCLQDAEALVELYPRLHADVLRFGGPNVERNLIELFQPYSLLMAEASLKGLRFDGHGWDRLLSATPKYRQRHLTVLREHGYMHDGAGIGDRAFSNLIRNLGLEADCTPTGKLSTKDDDIKAAAARYSHPALDALRELIAFDGFMTQDIGGLVDLDGRIRCGILPLAQRSGRNSTVSPNLMGMPGKLRPLLLPDEGCRFVHFDYSQQEPGVAGYLSGDAGLMGDFSSDDVYINLGIRLRLITELTPPAERMRIRKRVLKSLMLAILYGKSAYSVAHDLGRSFSEARVILSNFRQTYPRLFSWLESYVCVSLQRGWGENIIGFRAAFNVRDQRERRHIARSCQNFPIQSSAAACFQLTGVYLGQFGSEIRLPMHDAYVINVSSDPQALADETQRVISATVAATEQLFPGLDVKRDIEILSCFAKDRAQDSLESLLAELEAPE